MENLDIVIRKVNGYGFLGFIMSEEIGEIYRTGNYHKTEEETLSQVKKQIANDEFMQGAIYHRKKQKDQFGL